jgi:hypothetical protein
MLLIGLIQELLAILFVKDRKYLTVFGSDLLTEPVDSAI